MRRREFLTGAAGTAGLVAAGTGAPTAEARRRPIPETEVDAWLDELDADLDRMRRLQPIRPVRQGLVAAGLPEDLMGQSMATLTLTSAWQESSEAVQQHPAFVARLEAALPRFADDILRLTSWLEARPRAERRRARRMLRRPNHAHEALDAALIDKGRRADRTRRGHIRRRLGAVARLARERGSGQLVDDLVGAVDAACAECGIDRNQHVGSLGSGAPALVPAPDPDTPRKRQLPSGYDLVRLGALLLGISLLMIGGGLAIAALLGSLASPLAVIGLVIFCAGAALLFVALVMLLVGAILNLAKSSGPGGVMPDLPAHERARLEQLITLVGSPASLSRA
jgi:hypothetical protein